MIQEARARLLPFNIYVNPTYLLTICISCKKCIPNPYMASHQIIHHNSSSSSKGSKNPTKKQLIDLLKRAGASAPKPVPHTAIPAFDLLKCHESAFKCTVPSCAIIKKGHKQIVKHANEYHPDLSRIYRTSTPVTAQEISTKANERRLVEVIPSSQQPEPSAAARLIQAAAKKCNLQHHDDVYTATEVAQEKSLVFQVTQWDTLIHGVSTSALIHSASSLAHAAFPGLGRLKPITETYYAETLPLIIALPTLTRRLILSDKHPNIENSPFSRPQEMGTVYKDAHYVARFLGFLVLNRHNPIENYPVHLHPALSAQLDVLLRDLRDPSIPDQALQDVVHATLWMTLSLHSDQFIEDETQCLFTRFLIASNLRESGGFVRACTITPPMAQAQWCFRATAANQIRKLSQTLNNPNTVQ